MRLPDADSVYPVFLNASHACMHYYQLSLQHVTQCKAIQSAIILKVPRWRFWSERPRLIRVLDVVDCSARICIAVDSAIRFLFLRDSTWVSCGIFSMVPLHSRSGIVQRTSHSTLLLHRHTSLDFSLLGSIVFGSDSRDEVDRKTVLRG